MSGLVKEHGVAFLDAIAISGKPVAARRRLRLGRLLKIFICIALLAAAAGAVLVGQGHVTADNAVVSAYVLSLRTPIEGEVTGLRLRVGEAVSGAMLAHVTDARVNDDRLVEFRTEHARISGEHAAFAAQAQSLSVLRAMLEARVQGHQAATIAYAAATSDEAVAQLRGSVVHLGLTRRDMARKVTLGQSGDAAQSDVDRVTRDAGVAEASVAAQAARHASLRTRESAAMHGVLVDAGNSNDVSYSAQRIDEVDLRLSDVTRAMAVLAAAQDAVAQRLSAQERRFTTMADADMALPPRGMIWKLGVSNGERVSAGDTLAQVIDCEASFIVAAIPQHRFSQIELGAMAQFRLAGEITDREGRVLSVTGDTSISGDRNLAAIPVPDRAATAVVRVELPPSDNNGAKCLVGRTARVLLPVTGGGILAELRRFLP